MPYSAAAKATEYQDVRELLHALLEGLSIHDQQGTVPLPRDMPGWVADVSVISDAFDALLLEMSTMQLNQQHIRLRMPRLLVRTSEGFAIEVRVSSPTNRCSSCRAYKRDKSPHANETSANIE